jgi:hypothetical protein
MNIKQLLFALLLMTGCETDNEPGSTSGWPDQDQLVPPTGQQTFTLSGNEFSVNVMGNTQPRVPRFPNLAVKKGVIRGYVADMNGQPLKGAYIGVRVTLVGGLYSGVQSETDENGYYEISLPVGGVQFYATGYTIDYGNGRAVVGLHPADDNSSGFGSESGMVKNFIFQSYGVGNKDNVLHQPGNPFNYYGGAISLNYQVDWDNNVPSYLPENGEIEIELTPDGKGLFGENKSFKILKKIGYSEAIILNIPIGKYTIKAKLKDGRALKMTESGTYANLYPNFGLKPSGTVGTASIMFTPSWQATPGMVPAHHGNWQPVVVRLEIP